MTSTKISCHTIAHLVPIVGNRQIIRGVAFLHGEALMRLFSTQHKTLRSERMGSLKSVRSEVQLMEAIPTLGSSYHTGRFCLKSSSARNRTETSASPSASKEQDTTYLKGFFCSLLAQCAFCTAPPGLRVCRVRGSWVEGV